MQLRELVDGPRGLMAETLKSTCTPLPPHLHDSFSYLLPHAPGAKSSRSSRRSRRGSAADTSAGSVGGGTVNELAAQADTLGADAAA